ncbi:MAG: hypothetical protein U9R50_01325 [Campylobacterota bacterium]|nr:hypothetical protein [Campylobacterota bacterium]
MSDKRKTNAERIKRIVSLCEENFGIGSVRFVGVKYHQKIGWVAKVQFEDSVYFGNLTADGDDDTAALRNLKNRVKKIIKRYNTV